jgi:hypothetical protein
MDNAHLKLILALLFVAATAQATLTVTDRGTDTVNTSSTTWVIGPTSTIAAGSMGVLCLSFDNAGSAGSTKILSNATINDSVGNVWTRRLDFIYDPGAANAGVEVGVYTGAITTQMTSSDTITVTFSTATVAKTATWSEISASVGVETYITGAAKCDGCTSGQTSGTPQITTASLTVGDATICFMGGESTAAVTGDSDTTNGNWSTQQTDSSAGTNRIASQAKVQTTTGSTQSYDVTLTSCDWQTAYIQVREVTTSIKTVMDLANASVKTVSDLARASVKTIMDLP